MKNKTTREQAKKELGSKIVEILLLKPIYTKPGTSKDTSKDIETIHKRDELLALFEHLLEKEREAVRKEIVDGLDPKSEENQKKAAELRNKWFPMTDTLKNSKGGKQK